MNAKHIYLKDLHFEHKIWESELSFYKEELKIFQQRLGDVSLKNTKHEVQAQIEHFQNQFIRQNEVIDEYRHQINEHEGHLITETEKNPTAIEHRYFTDHKEMRDNMQIFRRLYGELKHEFMNFLVMWM